MKKPSDYAIEIATTLKDSLTQEELGDLAKRINRAIKDSVNYERGEQVTVLTERMQVLLAECVAVEKQLGVGVGEDDAPDECTTWKSYQEWKKKQTEELKEDLRTKRAEYIALKRLRVSIHQRIFLPSRSAENVA